MFQMFQGRGSRILIIRNYYVNHCQITNVQKNWANFVNGISRYVRDNNNLFTLNLSLKSLAGLIWIYFYIRF